MEGFEKLQRQLAQASEAFKDLDGEITLLHYAPRDQGSIEAAIADMKLAIDKRLSRYAGNPLVEQVAEKLKRQYEEQILDRSRSLRDEMELPESTSGHNDEILFRQIENTVTDLRRSETNTFGRHIEKLSRLLYTTPLKEISQELASKVDLDAWIKAGVATRGGMAGSARLSWPSDPKEELGLVIKLIEEFAARPK